MAKNLAANPSRFTPVFFFLVAAVIFGIFASILILTSATAGKVTIDKKQVIQPVSPRQSVTPR